MLSNIIYTLACLVYRFWYWFTDPYVYVILAARVFRAIGFYYGVRQMRLILEHRAAEIQKIINPDKKYYIKYF